MKRSRRAARADRRPARRAQLLIVLLFALASFSSAVHWLSTPHRMCEVHRTLEHGFEAEPAQHVASAPVGPVCRSEGRSHEECPLGPFARTDVAPLLEHDTVGSIVLRPTGWVACLRSEPRPESELFLLAPSRSPPA